MVLYSGQGSDNPVYLIVENGIIIGIDYSDPV